MSVWKNERGCPLWQAGLIKHVREDMNKSLARIVKSIEPLDDELVWARAKPKAGQIVILFKLRKDTDEHISGQYH
ncbi:hypothetical protein ACTID9_05720 [Brevibacillus fluminis]|uniref:hypothetical protein n=1 Tax=Brevibacillus fluminis TaxID=511487 RepID=UPI003F8990A2